MPGKIVSALASAMERLPDSLKPESVINALKNQGVKDAEIRNSGIEYAVNLETRMGSPSVSRENLLYTLDNRPDHRYDISERAHYGHVTLPDTRHDSYHERVYKNRVRSLGYFYESPHFKNDEDSGYVFHTRTDIVNFNHLHANSSELFREAGLTDDEVNMLATAERSGMMPLTYDRLGQLTPRSVANIQRVLPELDEQKLKQIQGSFAKEPYSQGANTLRIQEIQSDAYNDYLKILEKRTRILKLTTAEDLWKATLDEMAVLDGVSLNSLTYRMRLNLREVSGLAEETFDGLRNEITRDIEAIMLNAYKADPAIDPTWIEPEDLDLLKDYKHPIFDSLTDMIADKKDALARSPEPVFDVNFHKEAIAQELVRASEEGLSQVAIAIRPASVDSLYRAKSVQKTYETQVKNTAQKLARQIGGTFKMKNGYAVIGLPAGAFSLPLYAQENKDDSFIQTAVGRGMPEQDARKTLFVNKAMQQYGVTREQAEAFFAQQPAPQAQQVAPQPIQQQPGGVESALPGARPSQPSTQSVEALTPEDRLVNARANSSWWNPFSKVEELTAESLARANIQRMEGESNLDYERRAYAEIQALRDIGDEANFRSALGAKKVEKLVAQLEETVDVFKPMLELRAPFSQEQQAILQEENMKVATQVVQLAESYKLPLEYDAGEYYTYDTAGERIKVTPGLLRSMYGDKFEIGVAIAGGAAGARIGASLGGFWTGVVGGIVGAAAGSVAGTELDYIEALMATQQELDGKIAFEKAVGAGAASITYDLLFGGAYLGTKGTAALGRAGWNTLATVYEKVVNKNIEGAFEALQSETNLSPIQMQELITAWETLHRTDAPGKNLEEQALAIIPTMRAGGERIIHSTRAINPRAAANIARDVSERAQDLLDAAGAVSTEGSAFRVLESLKAVETMIKDQYTTVKGMFTDGDLPMGQPISYYEELGPIFDSMIRNMSLRDADSFNALIAKTNRVLEFSGNISTPSQLLELRRNITDIKYSGGVLNAETQAELSQMVHIIDRDIERIAVANMGEQEAKAWLSAWEQAQEEYSKNLQLRSNVLWKALTAKGTTPKTVADALLRYGPAIDDAYHTVGGQPVNTYRQVIDSLPEENIAEAEGLILNGMLEKFTIGNLGQVRAVQFPELAQQLRMFEFRTPEVQQIHEVIEELAKVHQIDLNLLLGTGSITMEQFQSYLTANPVTRLQFEVASNVFNFISSLKPGATSGATAMVKLTAEFLNEPLNVRTVNELMEEIGADQNFVLAVRNLQAEAAKAIAEGRAYAGGRAKLWKDTSGKLFLKEAPGLVPADPIPLARIAREDFVMQKYGMQTLDMSNMPLIRRTELINMGYEAVALSNGQVVKLF